MMSLEKQGACWKGCVRSLKARRISLVHFTRPSVRMCGQRLQGPGFVNMNHEIELERQGSPEVVAHALGFRPVDDTDRSLEAFHPECSDRFIFRFQVDKKTLLFQGGKEFFVTAGQRGADRKSVV